MNVLWQLWQPGLIESGIIGGGILTASLYTEPGGADWVPANAVAVGGGAGAAEPHMPQALTDVKFSNVHCWHCQAVPTA